MVSMWHEDLGRPEAVALFLSDVVVRLERQAPRAPARRLESEQREPAEAAEDGVRDGVRCEHAEEVINTLFCGCCRR